MHIMNMGMWKGNLSYIYLVFLDLKAALFFSKTGDARCDALIRRRVLANQVRSIKSFDQHLKSKNGKTVKSFYSKKVIKQYVKK